MLHFGVTKIKPSGKKKLLNNIITLTFLRVTRRFRVFRNVFLITFHELNVGKSQSHGFSVTTQITVFYSFFFVFFSRGGGEQSKPEIEVKRALTLSTGRLAAAVFRSNCIYLSNFFFLIMSKSFQRIRAFADERTIALRNVFCSSPSVYTNVNRNVITDIITNNMYIL